MVIRKVTYFCLGCALLVCVMVVLERPAYAYYVDPGSGLFLLQSVSTAALGVLYVIRRKLKLVKKPKTSEAAALPAVASPKAESARVS
jgi:hypothetical protein